MTYTFRKNATGIASHFHISKMEEYVISISVWQKKKKKKKVALLRIQYGPCREAQLVGASSLYPMGASLISGQSTYKNQLMNAWMSGAMSQLLSFSLSLTLTPSSLPLKSIYLFKK